MSHIARLGQEFGAYVLQLTAQLLGGEQAKSLSEMERQTREMLLKLGQHLIGAWLAMQEEQYPADAIACACGRQAKYQFRREGTLLTVVGQVSYRRAYYLCPACHQVGSAGLCSAEFLLQFRNHKGIVVQYAFGATEGDRPRHST